MDNDVSNGKNDILTVHHPFTLLLKQINKMHGYLNPIKSTVIIFDTQMPLNVKCS